MRGTIYSMILALLMSMASLTDAFQVETVASGLEHPWSIAFMPDGRMLVTERAGRLRLIDGQGNLLDQAIAGVPEAHVAGQGGLMEVRLHPDFETNGWIYLSLAHGTRQANATRVVRGRLDGMRWSDNEIIFTARPTRSTPAHYGARMTFMDDRTLLITIGDGFNYREDAQRLDSHTGTIVRVADDGTVPPDNPFVDEPGALPEIYSYGHRNPQAIVFDPETGQVWAHEHGPRGGDELNLIRPGENYGWPLATHGIDYSGARISPWVTRPGMVDPLIDWTPSIAPAGMSQYRGELFADWNGDLLVASLIERTIRRIRLDGETVVSDEPIGLNLGRRLRDVQVGPDGALYVLTDEKEGEVLQVTR